MLMEVSNTIKKFLFDSDQAGSKDMHFDCNQELKATANKVLDYCKGKLS